MEGILNKYGVYTWFHHKYNVELFSFKGKYIIQPSR